MAQPALDRSLNVAHEIVAGPVTDRLGRSHYECSCGQVWCTPFDSECPAVKAERDRQFDGQMQLLASALRLGLE